MKTKIVLLLLILALTLAACQPNTTPTVPPNGTNPTPNSSAGNPAYPAPSNPASGKPYPNPDNKSLLPAFPSAYPAPGETWSGSQVFLEWADAIKPVLNGDALAVYQKPDGADVVIYLKDGSRIFTKVSADGDIQNLLSQCGDKCKDIKHIP